MACLILRQGKKCIALFLLLCLIFGQAIALATTDEAEPVNEAPAATQTVDMSDVTGAVLTERNSGQALMGLDADVPRPVAGLCKLPALLVLCEAVDQGILNLSQEVTVSQRAAGISGPTAFIENGEIIEASHLMKAAAMICAGDAIQALGEAAFGTEGAFLDQITTRLQQLDIPVELTDAIGLGTQFSPNMLSKLGAALMTSECFTAHSVLTLETFTHRDGRTTELVNANKMLRNYSGCTGVATGSSPQDGYAGVFAVARGDTQLICVVVGAKNSSVRFRVAQDMLDQAYATLRTQKLAEKGEVLAENIKVKGGRTGSTSLVAKETVVLLLEKAEPALTAVQSIPEVLQAPVGKHDVVGTISYQNAQGVERGMVELVPEEDIPAYSLRDCIRTVILVFLRD